MAVARSIYPAIPIDYERVWELVAKHSHMPSTTGGYGATPQYTAWRLGIADIVKHYMKESGSPPGDVDRVQQQLLFGTTNAEVARLWQRYDFPKAEVLALATLLFT